jgi:hypothetical protein
MSHTPDALRYILWRYSQDHTGEDHQARVVEAQAWLKTLPESVPFDDIERILREHDMVYGYKREANLLVRRVQRWLDSLPRQDKGNADQIR